MSRVPSLRLDKVPVHAWSAGCRPAQAGSLFHLSGGNQYETFGLSRILQLETGARPSRSLCSASRRTAGAVDSMHHLVRCALPARRRGADGSGRDDRAPHQL